jgi:secondary thiamine-phosphate synthase enzyme
MVITKYLEIRTSGKTDIVDITDDCRLIVNDSGLTDGIINIFNPGSTASLTTIEFDPNLIKDFKNALEIIAPYSGTYEHGKTWNDDNGASHIRASLMGPSITVPVNDGDLVLGTWQQIVLCDFDTRSRNRKLVVKVIGE